MNGREVICLLVLFTVTLTAAQDEKPVLDTSNLWIEGVKVTLSCPGTGEGTEWQKGTNILKEINKDLIFEQYKEKDNGLYKCTRDGETHYFYTNLKVCENCVELEASLATGIIFADILFTLGIIFIIYVCAKKKAPPAPSQRAADRQLPRQTGAPTPPNPDYQVLNPATRSKDVYAEARRKY